MTHPSITVVVPTRRRAEPLRRVLAGLARQIDPAVPWEVIVVDNDGLPGTAQTEARAALDAIPVPARVVVEPALGASNARNRGIAEAAGTLVAFIDDDVVPDDDWLVHLTEPLLAGRCEGVGGRVELDPSVARPRWMAIWAERYLAHYDLGEDEVDLEEVSDQLISEPYLLTANAAFTAEILRDAGGLDPRLGPRDGVPFVNDDLSLCRRVRAAGGRIRYLPSARVVHELPTSRLTRRYLLRRLYAQGRSDWLLDDRLLGPSRSGGVAAGLRFLADDLRQVVGARRRRPAVMWAAGSLARRSGFLREAVANLRRRRRDRSLGSGSNLLR